MLGLEKRNKRATVISSGNNGSTGVSPVHKCSWGSHSQHAQSLWSCYHENREITTREVSVYRLVSLSISLYIMKANSLGIIFDLFSLTSVSYESHPPPNGGLDPLLCEELPLLHCQTQALTRGPIHWWQRETLDHTKLWACIVHKLASPLQFLAHLMLDSLVPTARPFLPLLFQTGDVEGLGSRLLQKVCLLCHVIVYVVMVSMLFYYKITVKHNLKMHTNIYLYKAHSDNHNMLTQLYTYSHAVNYPSSLYVSNFAHITYSDVILYCAYQRHFALLFWVNDLHRFWSRTNSAPFGREVEKEEWVFTHTCMQGYKVQPNALLQPLLQALKVCTLCAL